MLLHPRSHGTVTLRSADPTVPVRIANNFLSAPEDLATIRRGFLLARDLAHQPTLDRFRGQIVPNPEVRTDAEIDAWIRATVITVNHPLGTCALSQWLQCRAGTRLEGAWHRRAEVVDASALPDMPSRISTRVVMMLAERASDLIVAAQHWHRRTSRDCGRPMPPAAKAKADCSLRGLRK